MQEKIRTVEAGTQELSPVLREMLAAGASVRLTVTGNSMFPMLHDRLDSVVLRAADGEVAKYDLPLYCREDGSLILHRVVKKKNGIYTMCGDNQCEVETPVQREQILAVAVSFVRRGKEYSVRDKKYMLYVRLWVFLRPFRPFIIRNFFRLKRWQNRRKMA